jgi:hypothetical protein
MMPVPRYDLDGRYCVNLRDYLWLMASLFVWWDSDPNNGPAEEPVSRSSILAIIVLLLFLILAGLRIVTVLRQADTLQDCVMQGRTNCIPPVLP